MSSYDQVRVYWSGMGLSVRVINVLLNEGIDTIDQLMTVNYRELLRSPNFGVKSLKELKEKTGFPPEPIDVPDLSFTDARLILELRKRGYTVSRNGKEV